MEQYLLIIKWLGHYMWNTDLSTIMDVAYPGAVNQYKDEKIGMFHRRGAFEWFFDLDNEHQARVLQAAIDKYQK